MYTKALRERNDGSASLVVFVEHVGRIDNNLGSLLQRSVPANRPPAIRCHIIQSDMYFFNNTYSLLSRIIFSLYRAHSPYCPPLKRS